MFYKLWKVHNTYLLIFHVMFSHVIVSSLDEQDWLQWFYINLNSLKKKLHLSIWQVNNGNYGNWTEWSAINWSEIICMILKSNKGAAQVQFKSTSMISDQNCMTRSSITTLLQPFWNHRIQSVPIFIWSSSWFVKKRRQKGFYILFCARNRNGAKKSENGEI